MHLNLNLRGRAGFFFWTTDTSWNGAKSASCKMELGEEVDEEEEKLEEKL